MQLFPLSLPDFTEEHLVADAHSAGILGQISQVRRNGGACLMCPAWLAENTEIIGVQHAGLVAEREVVHAARRVEY